MRILPFCLYLYQSLKLAKLIGIESNTISLSMDLAEVPITTCDDGCAANVKRGCLLRKNKGSCLLCLSEGYTILMAQFRGCGHQ